MSSAVIHSLAAPRALILAAGVGNRLGAVRPDGPHPPKVLLRFGGYSLLGRRAVEVLIAAAVARRLHVGRHPGLLGIENRLHWRPDVSMNETKRATASANGAKNLAVLRHMALNLLRKEPSRRSLPKKFRRAGKGGSVSHKAAALRLRMGR